ncbi:hypothetical protein Tcan_03394 [Toxocara canis]|uniref:Uncharacterized protein n=1 Tax=Toxocara canis TaxID=6265 RepID=A0A0B2V5T9_TOXCA|nr:hypothetical protein Tcan_03394 [Toxocara canis]
MSRTTEKDDNVNYLVWSESSDRKIDGRHRSRRWSSSESGGRLKRNIDSRTSVDLERRKIGFDWAAINKEKSESGGMRRSKGEMGIIDFHLLLNIGGSHFRVRCSTIEVIINRFNSN